MITRKNKSFTVVGIITARGGSKGIPRKNIKLLAGKPLIYYTISEAKKSKYLTRTIVSTDDKEIAEISKSFGAEVLFMRPKYLAGDKTATLLVVRHAMKKLEEIGEFYDYVLILQPTSPFRLADDIDKAIEKALKVNADSLVSVVRISGDCHPLKAKRIENGLVLPFYLSEPEGARRQDLPPAYKRNGAIYLMKTELPLKRSTLYGKKIYSYEMPKERSVDINSQLDFDLAEVLMKKREKQKIKST